MIETPPEPRQLLPIEENHEIGQQWIAVYPPSADLPRQVHAHAVPAQCEERTVTEAEDSGIPPDQIEAYRQERVAEVFACEREHIRGDMKRRRSGHELIGDRNSNRRHAAKVFGWASGARFPWKFSWPF